MKKTAIALVLLSLAALSNMARAADTKVHGRVYSNWMLDQTEGSDDANEFGISRAYVTVKSKLSDYTSVRITTDLKVIDDRYDIILKYAYLDWKPAFAEGRLKVRFGLQPTLYIDNMNKLWGRRYLAKTVGDARKFLTSSDMGVGAHLGLGQKSKYGFVSLTVFNGTSYSHVGEVNKQKDFNAVAVLSPLTDNDQLKKSKLIAQFYSGTQNEETGEVMIDTNLVNVATSDWKRQIVSVGGLLAYNGTVDAGFDANFTTMGEGYDEEEVKMSGISFFGTLYLDALAQNTPALRTLNLFGRVDIYDPNTDMDDDGETEIIAGIECSPVKGVKASVNYRTTSFQDDTEETEKALYLNTLVKF